MSSRISVARPVLLDLPDGRRLGTLERVGLGAAIVRTTARPPIGTELTMRVYGTDVGELALPTLVRWHTSETLGLQVTRLRASDALVVHRLPESRDPSPRFVMQRRGFELDAVDVLALSRHEPATTILPPLADRRTGALWLRNARFRAFVLEIGAERIVVTAGVSLEPGTRVAVTLDDAPERGPIAACVRAVAARRTVLSYAVSVRHAA